MRLKPTAAILIAVGMIGIVAVLGVTIEPGGSRVDRSAMVIAETWRTDVTIAAAQFLDWIGGGLRAVVVAALATVALALARRGLAAATLALAAIISSGVVDVLKAWIARARPDDGLVEAGVGSFPSGHSANAAVLAMALSLAIPRVGVWIAAIAVTLAMMASRMILGVHWLSDVTGGALLGAAIVLIVWTLVQLIARGARTQTPREDGLP